MVRASRFRPAVIVLLGALLAGGAAGAAPRCSLDGRPRVLGEVVATDGAATGRLAPTVDARVGERVRAYLVAPGRLDGKRVVFAELPSGSGARRYTSWRAAGCPAVAVAWRRVEPRMLHVATPPPNAGNPTYSNAVLFGPRHGRWIGWDPIEYAETPVDGAALEAGGWRATLADARPGDPALDTHGGLGVMRLAATVTAPGAPPLATPAPALPDGRDGPGVSDRVFRYTVRAGDDLLGWLTTWFNVPYLFASAGHGARAQAERYVGADCADVIVAALRRAGRRDLDYSSVAELLAHAERVAGPLVLDGEAGTASAAIPIGPGPHDAHPGDLLVLDYVGWDATPREWDHVVVLAKDRAKGPLADEAAPGDGLLGPEDLAADSGGTDGLVFAPLARQGKVRVIVLRVPPVRRRRGAT